MKATEAKFLEFLKKSPQFVIPIYQRTYSWSEKECRQLWDDILRTGRNDAVSAHFVGSIVYVEKGLYSVTSQSALLVIDGQQRVTTVTLLIEALARSLGEGEPLEGFSARKLRNYYLLNPEETGEKHYKLVLSQTDKASLIALLDQHPKPKDHSIRVEANFEFFKERVAEVKGELPALCKGLAKLVIVDLSLNRDQDNPQLIFESLNSTGRELSQADLIRNFILMGLEPQLQTKLYEQYWRPMEVDFGQEGYGTHFDSFMRHYLTVKTGEIPNVREVYEAFKQYARSPKVSAAGVEALVADIRAFAGYYCAMALGSESDADLKAAFHDIRELKVDVAFPFLLELYADCAAQVLAKAELLQASRWVEGYVFRRAVCGIPTNSMNKTFATFARALKKDRYLESVQAHFLLLPSYRRFPTDDEFQREVQIKDLYNFRSRSYWLRRMENHDRKERAPVDEYTIEHILPQNENLSPQWKADLGPEWERIQKTCLHTLGNLTLTGYNPELSDRPFIEKRDMKGGFAESPLRMNQGLAKLDGWTEEAIRERGGRLAAQAASVWPAPSLPADILDAYKPKAQATGYSIKDHPHLITGALRDVFEAFRKQVLALDPCVTEEFLKLYVAYKAETNFVDIVPQAKRIVLSFNIAFPEISDPKGICKDVSGLGRWGNGDVEIGLTSLDELPYVMGLVRQAFEKQMGNGGDA
ncbi:MAG: GmrSD restriction endonuclease domain-containing protein [Gammaproteobacteria bacterium]